MGNDLKPDNILVMDEYTRGVEPRAVVADYGCLTLRDENKLSFGNPTYWAPESFSARQKHRKSFSVQKQGPKVDIWAMGVTLFELLSGGVFPFVYQKLSPEDVRRAVILDKLEAALRKPSTVEVRPYCVDVHEEAEALLKQLLHADADQRPEAMEALRSQWFTEMSAENTSLSSNSRRRVHSAIAHNIQFTASRAQARQILLNALAHKLEYKHLRECHIAFNEFDVDNSGLLSRTSFTQALEQLGKDTSDADAIFDKADIDKSGELEFNEFVALTYDWRSLDNGHMDRYIQEFMDDIGANAGGPVGLKDLRKLFEGVLTQDQVIALVQQMKDEKQQALKGPLQSMSAGDDEVSLNDFKMYLQNSSIRDLTRPGT